MSRLDDAMSLNSYSLMSDICIHLKGCAKTTPLHTALPANPRYWLGTDPKATPVGLCATQSQVTLKKYHLDVGHRQIPRILIHGH